MQLLIVRHAIAEDREDFSQTGQPDDLRPLTPKGLRRMRQAARGLVSIVPHIDLLATSPLVRAVQTADVLAEAYGSPARETVDALAPDAAPNTLLTWLRRHRGQEIVAVVGHEPHLSTLTAWLLTGEDDSLIALKKGSATLLEFGRELKPGAATLLWALTPAHLRRLAD